MGFKKDLKLNLSKKDNYLFRLDSPNYWGNYNDLTMHSKGLNISYDSILQLESKLEKSKYYFYQKNLLDSIKSASVNAKVNE